MQLDLKSIIFFSLTTTNLFLKLNMIDPACSAVFPTIGNKKNHADQAILLRKIQSPIVDPRFLYVFPLDGVTRFFYLFGENLII